MPEGLDKAPDSAKMIYLSEAIVRGQFEIHLLDNDHKQRPGNHSMCSFRLSEFYAKCVSVAMNQSGSVVLGCNDSIAEWQNHNMPAFYARNIAVYGLIGTQFRLLLGSYNFV